MLFHADTPDHIGSIRLWDHQREAVHRVALAIAEFGGALLADEVGLGKTHVALALATRYTKALVVAPAALAPMWRTAFESTGSTLPWLSFELLSRGREVALAPDLVIADEAHHVRNPRTRRYSGLAKLCVNADVLLLSATPLHNTRRDLGALLALFLGASADALDEGQLSRLIIRRTSESVARHTRIPRVGHTVAIPVPDEADVGARLAALPPSLPPMDGGAADRLVAFTLARQWASSVGALRGALRRRIGRTHALIETLRTGRLPSRAELGFWLVGDDSQQLAFAELLAPFETGGPAATPSEMLAVALRHRDALDSFHRSLGTDDDADRRRAAALRRLVDLHRGERIIAFSQFADTVEAYRRQLRDVTGVCALSAKGGRVSGGHVTRAEVIARFSPLSNARQPTGVANEIRLLLTTDLLSEGVNLQDASVIVHLDLPWTAARVEQRVGRAARAGSRHDTVSVYAMSPPQSAEALLEIGKRLRKKSALAAAAVGPPAEYLDQIPAVETSPAAATERLRRVVGRWPRSSRLEHTQKDECLVAVVGSSAPGWLALLRSPRGDRLVGAASGRLTTQPSELAAIAALAAGDEHSSSVGQEERDTATNALLALSVWLAEERAASLAGVPSIGIASARRAFHHRVAGIESAPRTRRVALDAMATDARTASSKRMGVGGEQRMMMLNREPDVERWLEQVAALSPPRQGLPGGEFDESPVALLLLLP